MQRITQGLHLMLIGALSLLPALSTQAASTVPETLVYQGDLRDTAGNPLSGNYVFRLSLWDSIDHVASDASGTDINVAAPNYLGWNETHPYSIVDGRFALDLGSVTPFPNTDIFDRSEIFLQVEIGLTPTTLELVDSRPETTIDRLKFFSMPYAFNADKLDWRDTGFDADEIPYLDGNAQLPESTIPGGTNEDGFIINADGNDAFLQFGNNIANQISLIFADDVWDFAAKRLQNILDPTNPQDAATKSYVDTLISGIIGGGAPISGISGNTFDLDQDADANPTDTIQLNFGGATGEFLNWNGTNDQFEFSDDVIVGGNLVVTGTINGQAIGPIEEHKVFTPHYDGAVFEGDGSDNTGGMYDGTVLAGPNKKNVIKWVSRENTLQDYNVQIRYELPQDFVGFVGTDTLEVNYITNGTITDSLFDIIVEKEGSATDELSGSGLGLNNNTFTNTALDLNATTTWNAGDVVLITMVPKSRDQNEVSLGDVKLKYIVQ